MKIQGVGSVPVYTDYQSGKSEGAQVQDVQVSNEVQNVQQTSAIELGNTSDNANDPNGDDNLDNEIIKKSVEQANQSLKAYNRYIERDVHEVTHAIIYKIKDSKTNEVIAEFPPKKIQDMIAKMWEIAGLFVDERA